MNIPELRENWDAAARENAMFNIMSVPLTPDEFWQTGEREVDELLKAIDLDPTLELGAPTAAMDFGCGIGRVTRALADWFDTAVGVDVSELMLDLARDYDFRPSYIWNEEPDLRRWDDDTFDLVYSNIVLQHMPSEMAGGYVREFLRVSRGFVVFQIPEGPDTPGNGRHAMFGTPRETVLSWLADADSVEVVENDAAGPGRASYRYIVRVP